MPSTLFTAPAHWHWLVIVYFFVGGLAGGSYFLAALVDFFGRPADRPLARIGYYIALPATVVSGILLILDLSKPLRFWHMLVQSETWRPMLKYWSPMSLGSWALLIFGAFTLLAFLAALAEAGRLRSPLLRRLRPPALPGTIVAVVGGILGFFVAGYTGVLLAVTNRPIWSDTNLLGLVFLVSAASTSAALLVLLARGRPWAGHGVVALERFDSWMLVLELLALVALVVSLGSLARLWLNVWGVLLLATALIGIVLPLVMYWRTRALALETAVASVLVLAGGFLLRVIIVMSSETL
jgi:formate-dependent nitrite reductase membrane component NrfD